MPAALVLAAAHGTPPFDPIIGGAIIFVIMIVLLLVTLAYGKGRPHV